MFECENCHKSCFAETAHSIHNISPVCEACMVALLGADLAAARQRIGELEAVLRKLLGPQVLILDHYGRALIPHSVTDIRYMVDNMLGESHERT